MEKLIPLDRTVLSVPAPVKFQGQAPSCLGSSVVKLLKYNDRRDGGGEGETRSHTYLCQVLQPTARL